MTIIYCSDLDLKGSLMLCLFTLPLLGFLLYRFADREGLSSTLLGQPFRVIVGLKAFQGICEPFNVVVGQLFKLFFGIHTSSFLNSNMARLTNGNHVKPVYLIITLVMMILFSLISTTTYLSSYFWQLPVSNSVVHSGSGLVLQFDFWDAKILGLSLVAPLSVSFVLAVLLLVGTNSFPVLFLVNRGAAFALPVKTVISTFALAKLTSILPDSTLTTPFHFLLQIKTPLYGRSVLADISNYPIKRGRIGLYRVERYLPISLPGLGILYHKRAILANGGLN